MPDKRSAYLISDEQYRKELEWYTVHCTKCGRWIRYRYQDTDSDDHEKWITCPDPACKERRILNIYKKLKRRKTPKI